MHVDEDETLTDKDLYICVYESFEKEAKKVRVGIVCALLSPPCLEFNCLDHLLALYLCFSHLFHFLPIFAFLPLHDAIAKINVFGWLVYRMERIGITVSNIAIHGG